MKASSSNYRFEECRVEDVLPEDVELDDGDEELNVLPEELDESTTVDPPESTSVEGASSPAEDIAIPVASSITVSSVGDKPAFTRSIMAFQGFSRMMLYQTLSSYTASVGNVALQSDVLGSMSRIACARPIMSLTDKSV